MHDMYLDGRKKLSIMVSLSWIADCDIQASIGNSRQCLKLALWTVRRTQAWLVHDCGAVWTLALGANWPLVTSGVTDAG
jgi:hypothetical protein